MRRLLLVVLTVAVTVGLAGAPASAQTKTRKDEVGDAPARYDLRSAKVRNSASALVVKTRFTTVKKRRTGVFTYIAPRGTDRVLVVDSFPVSKGRYKTILVELTGDDQSAVSCPGLRSTWKKGKRGTARVVVPSSCLGDVAGTLEVQPVGYDKRTSFDGERLSRALRADEDLDPLGSVVTVRRG